PRLSLARIVSASGDTQRLSQNLFAQRRKDRVAQNDVDVRDAEQLFQSQSQRDELEQRNRSPDIHQHVDVARRAGFVAGGGSEQRNVLYAEIALKLFAAGTEDSKDL